MADHVIQIVGLCQVNDIIPVIYQANNLPADHQEPEKLVVLQSEDGEAINVPSVADMERLIQAKGIRKKGYQVSGLKRYLLLSSLHNRGMGCGGTSPLIAPLAVYLVEEDGSKFGGIYCDLKNAYAKLRELVQDHFTGGKEMDPLLVVTPELNKKILKKQLRPGKIPLEVEMVELQGECVQL